LAVRSDPRKIQEDNLSGKLINPASMSNGRVQTVQQAIAQLAMRLARYAVAWLVVAISLMGLAQATFWATTQTPLYIGLCVATTIYLALIWLLLRQGQIPELMIHGFMVTAVVWPTLILTFANISLLENWYPTIPLALGVLALGIVILDHDWLTVALVSIMGSWLLFALSVPLSSPWAFHTLVLLATSTLSWTINRAYLTFLTNQMLIRQEAEEQQTLLARRSLQLELGIAVGKGISTMRDLDSLLNEVVALLRENFGFRHVGVFLLDEHNDYIMPRAYHYEGVDGQSLDLDHLKLHVGQEGVVGWAAGQREVVCVNDTLLDWRYATDVNLPHIQAELVVPLLVQGNLLGVLDIQSPERNAFAPDDDLEVFQVGGGSGGRSHSKCAIF
jgi:putative methionine-R-sulfoxide reductase with GAF domain